APTVPIVDVQRRYRENTLILETEFITENGTVKLIDFMPPRQGREHSVVCRLVRCVKGSVPMRSVLSPRLSFGRAVPRGLPVNGATKLFAGPDALYLRGGPTAGSPALVAEFAVTEGKQISYSLGYAPSYEGPPPAEDASQAERATEEFWSRWC